MDGTVRYSPERHAPILQKLARENKVWLGTSSWIYEGWCGQVYNKSYEGPRKDFVLSKFREDCLKEYAENFPTVCLDAAYWRIPSEKQLLKYRAQLPPDFRMAMKATDMFTARRHPHAHRVKELAGELNTAFLNVEVFNREFISTMKATMGEQLGPIILEFSPFFFGKSFGEKDGYSPMDFVHDLHGFLERADKSVKLAVEVRDPEFLRPNFTRYFDCLRYHKVAHVFNEQTWMPPIEEQIELPLAFTASYVVVRALTRAGVKHNDAVEEFEPYTQTQHPLPGMRRAIAKLASRPAADGLYAYINNRSEGNAPNTIASVLEQLDLMEGEKPTSV
jgi:uncharacterized protein YecE (DUF72 family)